MKIKPSLLLSFQFFFFANYTFAANFYFESSQQNLVRHIVSGDLNFSYVLTKTSNGSKEVFEKNLTRFIVDRQQKTATMWIEQRTKYGFLLLEYKPSGKSWENTQITFRKYESFFKDNALSCNSPPSQKNQMDVGNISNVLEKKNFANLFFENNCTKSLSQEEYQALIDSTYTILKEDTAIIEDMKEPLAIACVKPTSLSNPLYTNFKTLRHKTLLLLKNSTGPNDIKNDPSTPFPISCEFKGQSKNKCGSIEEGPKTQIRINASCLKKDPKKLHTIAQGIILHEFAHTIREPERFTEKQIDEIDRGRCSPPNILVTGPQEVDLSKEKVIQQINSQQKGTKTLAGDVVNPYSSFIEPANARADQNVVAAVRAPANTLAATATTTTEGAVPSLAARTTSPSPSQQAQYYSVKASVDKSMGVISRKIAPIVAYVESPAFAATLPADSATSTTEVGQAKSASRGTTKNRAPSSETGASNEVASFAPSKTNSPPSRGKPSTSATDFSLDNAYALKVRRKLLSENAYRESLRRQGVEIRFADGYHFENSGAKILYIEKNGVLVRGAE